MISSQVIHKIEVDQLKGIVGLSSLKLDVKAVTAITGANGCGKSTLLHALACVYRPQSVGGLDYKFPRFFLPTSDGTWSGSSFRITYSYKSGPIDYSSLVSGYAKQRDRWSPRYDQRPVRNVVYLGIDTCVPAIERESAMSYMHLTALSSGADAVADEIRRAASYVMNKMYDSSTKKVGRSKTYRGVTSGLVSYSSLTMGAGEQRVFEILDAIFRAQKYSLILIDEIDLLMHMDAFDRLINVVVKRAGEKCHQVVFTTHRETVLDRGDIEVVHIFSAGGKTMSMPGAHPDVYKRLTGRSKRPMEIFVEDDFSKAIVDRVCSSLDSKRFVETVIVGAAVNLFTLAGGLSLRRETLRNKLFVLDGDVYRDDSERMAQVSRVVTGHDASSVQARSNAFDAISMFCLPLGFSPEGFLHSLVMDVGDAGGEVFHAASQIAVVQDSHDFVRSVIAHLGDDRQVGLVKIIDVASKADRWESFVEPIRNWVSLRVSEFGGAGRIVEDLPAIAKPSIVLPPLPNLLPSKTI